MRIAMSVLLLLLIHDIQSQELTKVEPAFPDDFIQIPNVRDFTINLEENEAWFSAQSPDGAVSVIFVTRKKQKEWSAPEIAPFSGKYQDLEPFLSPDGLMLLFASNRPRNDTAETTDFDIWYVSRADHHTDWSSPVNVGEPVNSVFNEFYPCVTENKNLYFTSDARSTKGHDDIFFCEWANNTYSDPVSLSDSINTEGYEFNAFVAPDESFLIFTGYNRDDGYGSGDLYISFRDMTGNWGQALNLGEEINSEQMDYCPYLNMNTATLYFTSRRNGIQAPANGFTSLKGFLSEVNKYENGFSRIYQVMDFKVGNYRTPTIGTR